MCLSPITLKKKRARLTYSEFQTNVVPCGVCVLCLKRRTNAWAFRMYQELKISSSAIFLTLTYSDEHLPSAIHTNSFVDYDTGEITDYTYRMPELRKTDFQKFMKRLRKQTTNKLRFYMCGEYGDQTKRPHYHAIIFNLPQKFIQDSEILAKTWNLGNIHIGECNMGTIKYTTKYIMKRITGKNTTLPPEFSLMSKNLGLNYLTDSMQNYLLTQMRPFLVLPGGEKMAIPRYYRNKIFNKVQTHKLKLISMDLKEEQYIKLFNNNHKLYHEWKKNQIRVGLKLEKLNRQKL